MSVDNAITVNDYQHIKALNRMNVEVTQQNAEASRYKQGLLGENAWSRPTSRSVPQSSPANPNPLCIQTELNPKIKVKLNQVLVSPAKSG